MSIDGPGALGATVRLNDFFVLLGKDGLIMTCWFNDGLICFRRKLLVKLRDISVLFSSRLACPTLTSSPFNIKWACRNLLHLISYLRMCSLRNHLLTASKNALINN